jgi:hypothetical protein
LAKTKRRLLSLPLEEGGDEEEVVLLYFLPVSGLL